MAISKRPLRRYLVVLHISPATVERAATVGAAARLVLQHIADGPIEVGFRSMSHDLFGFFVRTPRTARSILNLLQTPFDGETWKGGKEITATFLTNDDHVLIVEAGEDADTRGMLRQLTWLQRHPKSDPI